MRSPASQHIRLIRISLLLVASLCAVDDASAQATLPVNVSIRQPTGTGSSGTGAIVLLDMKTVYPGMFVINPPVLRFRIGNEMRAARYVRFRAPDTLEYSYVIAPPDTGTVSVPAFVADAEITTRGPHNTPREWERVRMTSIVPTNRTIDTTMPRITGITVRSDGMTSGKTCKPIEFDVTFSEDVKVGTAQNPLFPFSIGQNRRDAGRAVRSSVGRVTFTYADPRAGNDRGLIAYSLPSGFPFGPGLTDLAGNRIESPQPMAAATNLEVDCPPLPGVPSGLSAMSGSQSIRLRWNGTPNTTHYKLQRRGPLHASPNQTMDLGDIQPGAPGQGVVFDDSPPTDGRYEYTLRAVNDVGSTSAGSSVTALKDSTPPTFRTGQAPITTLPFSCVDNGCSNVGNYSFPTMFGVFNGGIGVAALLDNNPDTGIATATVMSQPYPHVTVDLGLPVVIDEIKVGSMSRMLDDGPGTWQFQMAMGLNGKTLEYSTDGQSFTAIGTVTGLTDAGQAFGSGSPDWWVAPIGNQLAARYLRLNSSDGSRINLSELKVSARAFVLEANPLSLSADATEDPYSSIARFQWRVAAGPANVDPAQYPTISPPNGPSATIQKMASTPPGAYRIIVTATNEVGLENSRDYLVRVR